MHETDFIGVGAMYDSIRERAFARRGVQAKMVLDAATGISYPIYELPDFLKMSGKVRSLGRPQHKIINIFAIVALSKPFLRRKCRPAYRKAFRIRFMNCQTRRLSALSFPQRITRTH